MDLQTYEFNNGAIKFLVRVDYIRSSCSDNKNFVRAKVIADAVRFNGRPCEKLRDLSKEQKDNYGLYFEIPLTYSSKNKRRGEVKSFIFNRLEKILNRFLQDRLIGE